jgi:hypothetical protein
VLDPYGTWVSDAAYGWVWVPSAATVGSDFSPYVTSGHWALDEDDNWVWVSDYPFGDVVFHYGRWVWVSNPAATGWAWVPGYRYAPAWVVWRVSATGVGYVGWAPMPPEYVWVDGGAVWLWYSPPAAYVFCPVGYVFYPHVHTYIVHDRVLVRHLGRSTYRYHPAYRTHRTAWGPSMRDSGVRAPGPRIARSTQPYARTSAEPRAAAPKSRSGSRSPSRAEPRAESRVYRAPPANKRSTTTLRPHTDPPRTAAAKAPSAARKKASPTRREVPKAARPAWRSETTVPASSRRVPSQAIPRRRSARD